MSMLSELAAADMIGHEQLRALFASGRQPNICVTLQFAAVQFEDGYAVFEGVPGEHAYNPLGTVHGGYAASLLDAACGCAVHSKLEPRQTYTILELKVAYHRAMTAGTGRVRAEGRILSFGRRAAFAEAKLVDSDGRLFASATSSLLIMSPTDSIGRRALEPSS